jgi:hypothetical protein
VGEVLRDRPLESVFLVYPKLGRGEDSASSGSGVPASRLRLEAVESGVAIRNVGALLGVPRFLCTVALGSRPSLIGPITLDMNCAGARSAGNPHATWCVQRMLACSVGGESHRGKSQKPRSLDSREEGDQISETYRRHYPWGDGEPLGRNESERRCGLESEWPQRPSLPR